MKDGKQTFEAQEKELEQALGNFRQSVQAWSEAELNRPRTMHAPVQEIGRTRSWRLVAAWALGCVLAVGGASTGLYEHHHHQVLARQAAEREARAQQLLAAQRSAAQARQNDESLLAAVDKDVSRTVPNAMEPLAQLMEEDTNTNQ